MTTQVLYIAGSGRSGTTLLGSMLGQIPGGFYAGEVNNLWKRGLSDNSLCGCGRPFSDCETWQAILKSAFGPARPDPVRMNDLRNRNANRSRVPLMFLPGGPKALLGSLGEYPEALERLHDAIGRTTGAQFIVDSSGSPAYGFVLDQLPSLDVRIIHLVRDSRAVVFSWTRRKVYESTDAAEVMMPRRHPMSSSLGWLARNLLVLGLWGGTGDRYHRLRYEDLVEQPQGSMRELLSAVGHERKVLDQFSDDRTIHLAPQHSVSGNPRRFDTGLVELRIDNEWKLRQMPLQRILSTLLTGPLLLGFGYSLRSR
jgi:hypothetical protein